MNGNALQFEAIAQFVGAHENFASLPVSQKLRFYALYKASRSKAPSHSFANRLYLFVLQPANYQRWLAWWLASDKFSCLEAEMQYCSLAQEIGALPPEDQLRIMQMSNSRGKGASHMVMEDEGSRQSTSEIDVLMVACAAGSCSTIATYLTNGGNIDVQNDEGMSLLHFAVDSNSIDMVKLLLEYDVDLNSLDDEGLSPLDCALLNGEDYQTLADMLRSHGAKASSG